MQPDDDLFAQFDLEGPVSWAKEKKPPPVNPGDGEPRPNGRKKGKRRVGVDPFHPGKKTHHTIKGKRGRPKKARVEEVEVMVKGLEAAASLPARKPRKARETKISIGEAAAAFTGLTENDLSFVTATIRNMSSMSAKQKARIARTLHRLFA